tara:strand:- start:725 stop:2569 length:1845 start_codon:yes stop_codon:yes gene_type:complete
MAINVKRQLKNATKRNYLAKDFQSFRNELYSHAKLFFSDKIQDFTEPGLGGLLLDMAAYVGDSMSFYLDHQFNELNWSTAVENRNIKRHLRNAGVKARGASPSVVMIKIYFELPAVTTGGDTTPDPDLLPKVLSSTTFVSNDGVPFSLLEDVDFAEKKTTGEYLYDAVVVQTDDFSIPTSFVVVRTGLAISGARKQEKFPIPNVSTPFRKIILPDENVTSIVSVKDSDGNEFYEVESLSQDTVFKRTANVTEDSDNVDYNLEVIPAPYRYISSYDYDTKLTTIQFGSGDATTTDNDLLPDPSELAIPLYGKKTFARFALDPNKLMQTQTLGIAPRNTVLTVSYRSGGGLRHNVGQDMVRTVTKLFLKFSARASAKSASAVRSSIDVSNPLPAMDGDRAPTLENLRSQIPAARNSQSRIVTKSDLISRIYTLPNAFGRVYRAGIRPNPINSLASQIFIVSRQKSGLLVMSSDTLKKNLRTYLNEFRAVSDAYDIMDAKIINLGVNVDVVAHPEANKSQVAQKIIANLASLLDIKNIQIDQPIPTSDIMNSIINSEGVISLVDFKVANITGVIEDRQYSQNSFNVNANTIQKMVVGPPGSIFEIRYPNRDLIVTVR